jgi:hypothetical protein
MPIGDGASSLSEFPFRPLDMLAPAVALERRADVMMRSSPHASGPAPRSIPISCATAHCSFLIATEPLSVETGEMIDKGCVNQRAVVIERRADLVAQLHRTPATADTTDVSG